MTQMPTDVLSGFLSSVESVKSANVALGKRFAGNARAMDAIFLHCSGVLRK
jgi:hypothetical protein